MKRVLGVIPARMKSTRFPGKPLVSFFGKPMVVWVCEAAKKARTIDKVVVATDDKKIAKVCEKYHFEAVLTRSEHKTGTDRVAELAEKRKADIYVNIQSDEPLIESETIDQTVHALIEDSHFEIVNLYTKIVNKADLNNINIPKVVVGQDNRAIFFSRLPIPYLKSKVSVDFYRQVCVYAFKRSALRNFSKLEQGMSEKAEEIEILRFLEHGLPVKMVEVKTRSFGIDTPEDLERAEITLKED